MALIHLVTRSKNSLIILWPISRTKNADNKKKPRVLEYVTAYLMEQKRMCLINSPIVSKDSHGGHLAAHMSSRG